MLRRNLRLNQSGIVDLLAAVSVVVIIVGTLITTNLVQKRQNYKSSADEVVLVPQEGEEHEPTLSIAVGGNQIQPPNGTINQYHINVQLQITVPNTATPVHYDELEATFRLPSTLPLPSINNYPSWYFSNCNQGQGTPYCFLETYEQSGVKYVHVDMYARAVGNLYLNPGTHTLVSYSLLLGTTNPGACYSFSPMYEDYRSHWSLYEDLVGSVRPLHTNTLIGWIAGACPTPTPLPPNSPTPSNTPTPLPTQIPGGNCANITVVQPVYENDTTIVVAKWVADPNPGSNWIWLYRERPGQTGFTFRIVELGEYVPSLDCYGAATFNDLDPDQLQPGDRLRARRGSTGEFSPWITVLPNTDPSNTPTPTSAVSPTNTPTVAPTATNTPAPTSTNTPTPTNAPTATNTPAPTNTNTPTPTLPANAGTCQCDLRNIVENNCNTPYEAVCTGTYSCGCAADNVQPGWCGYTCSNDDYCQAGLTCNTTTFTCGGAACSTPTPTPTLRQSCTQTGGRWISFTNSCADNCTRTSCTNRSTTSCDCGASSCWNGNRCVANTTTTPATTSTTSPSLFDRFVSSVKGVLGL